ncbi:MAG: hypothetical protein KAY37_17925, partial [Phycisphaerae bacterium]|nr:hypothetical protein [Phycisphaerae bacterium]
MNVIHNTFHNSTLLAGLCVFLTAGLLASSASAQRGPDDPCGILEQYDPDHTHIVAQPDPTKPPGYLPHRFNGYVIPTDFSWPGYWPGSPGSNPEEPVEGLSF